MKIALRLSWRLFRRDFASGEIRVLFAALLLAVTAVTAVGFLTDRAQRALHLEANRLLGGDAVLRADEPIAAERIAQAQTLGLRTAQTRIFPSMVRHVQALKLSEVHALESGYPLRGRYRVITAADAREHDAPDVPDPGTLWLSRDGAAALGAQLGDTVQLGSASLRVSALVLREPDAAFDYFAAGPRVFLNLNDLPATQLVQLGSRVTYRLAIAGDDAAVAGFVKTLRADLDRGQRVETVEDARPEVRSALARADRFLGLAALVSVVLAAVAVAMAARRHTQRHLDGCAVMRTLGASQARIAGVYLGQLLWLGALACTLGIALGFAIQATLGGWLAGALGVAIPAPSLLPALQGLATGLVVLLGFAAPPVLALRRVPTLRVLRRDVPVAAPGALALTLTGLFAIAALLVWKAGSMKLGLILLGGLSAAFAMLALLALALIATLRALRTRLRGPWRYGLANIGRRAGSSVAQITALGLGLTAVLLLTLVRTDLVERWRQSLPADAPNRFVINAQSDQIDALRAAATELGLGEVTLFPMVRGRLMTVNGVAVNASKLDGPRAQRLAEREFNLSWTDTLRDDNIVTAGKFWGTENGSSSQLSVEEGLATALGWHLGDDIVFDIAGSEFRAQVTSLRKVDWGSFRPNFFVLAQPGALDTYPASWITAFRVPADRAGAMDELVRRFPNLTVIDVEAVMAQVQRTANQVATAVQYVFYFTLAAGLLVLLAAVSATQDERLLDGAVMRVLGASRAQLRWAQLSEFAAIGLLAGLTAAIAAGTLAGTISTQVFDLPWSADWRLAAVGAGIGVIAVSVAGLLATRRVTAMPPTTTLRALAGA